MMDSKMENLIKSALRKIFRFYWQPGKDVLKDARVPSVDVDGNIRKNSKGAIIYERNKYKCACCGKTGPKHLPPLEGRKRKRNNAAIDHIDPVVSPTEGFQGWDEYIKRMFVKKDKLQILCYDCHRVKTNEENSIRRKVKKENK